MNNFRIRECKTRQELADELDWLCDDIQTRVIPFQKKHGQPFTFVYVGIWEDTGRVIAYPSNSQKDRIDVAGSQVQCFEIADQVRVLDHSNLGDHDHDVEIHKIVTEMAKLVMEVFDAKAVFPYKVFDQDNTELHRSSRLPVGAGQT